MIYNFVELLRNQFPTETIYINGRVLLAGQETIPIRCINVNDTGGYQKLWNKFKEYTIQILVRDLDNPHARKLAYDIFNFVDDRYGLILPAITIDGNVFPAIKTAQISHIQLPSNLGNDSNGHSEYTTNYKIII
jgi:hypothetical protein